MSKRYLRDGLGDYYYLCEEFAKDREGKYQPGISLRVLKGLKAFLCCFSFVSSDSYEEMFHSLSYGAMCDISELIKFIAPHVSHDAIFTKLSNNSWHVNNIAAFIASGFDVDFKPKDTFGGNDFTLLQYFCSSHDAAEGVDLLIKSGANVNIGEKFDHPLIIAAASGSWRIMELLMKAGAKLPSCPALGHVLTKTSCGFANAPGFYFWSLKMLINAGADVNEPYGPRMCTPLMMAIKNDLPRCAYLLISKGANTKAQDINGNTVKVYFPPFSYNSSEELETLRKELCG
jgi:hypothetical protein